MASPRPLAVLTGGTGFLGRHVAQALAADGWRLRLLSRRNPTDPAEGAEPPEVMLGDLADPAVLRSLCQGAQAVVHVAGLVKARSRAEFEAVNVSGAGRIAAAAQAVCPDAVFVLVSSLAARAPHLSAYAQSKRDGERAVAAALGARAWVVRPGAVYGPGDRQTLGLFRAVSASPVLPVLRRQVRVPLVHAEDAARTIAALAARAGPGRTVSLCDGRPDGYGLDEIMRKAAEAVGRRSQLVRVPVAAVRAVGLIGDVARGLGATPMATSGKVRELLDGDWRLAAVDLAPEAAPPRFGLTDGFRHTVAAYRAAGWLAS